MLRHPCGKSHREIHHARPSATLAPVSGIRPSSHGPSFLEALNPSFRQTRDRSVVGRSAAFSGPAYETLMLNTAFLGPVKLTLPMFVPGQRAALTLAVRNLHQNPREVQIHLLDAQQYNLSADLQYDVNALERAAPMALDVQLNRRAYRDSLVLRAALAERDGDPAKAQEWLAKGQIRAVPASLRSCRRSQILKWLQQVLALLAPVDILFGLKQFVRFLDAKMQISGLGQPVLVAICNVPRLDNAFFGGGYMVFGNGESQFYPLASLDVIGHEMGHGVIDALCPLKYQGHSGALNESFADVIGTCFEFYVFNKFNRNKKSEDDLTDMGLPDYEIGEDLDVQGRYLRNMAEPENAPFPQPSSVHGQYYVDPNSDFDYGGVHVNSGIPNVLFYRLAQKIGRVRAMQLFFQLLRAKAMPETCTFAEFGEVLLHFAQNFKCARACRELGETVNILQPEVLIPPPLPVPPPSSAQRQSADVARTEKKRIRQRAGWRR